MVSYGADVSRTWVDIVRTDNSRQCKSYDRIANERTALEAYWRAEQDIRPTLQVTVESTGLYQLTLVRTCLRLGIAVRLINPILTKRLTQTSVRKTKTDQKDAHRIALLGLERAGYPVVEEQLSQTKFYLRASSKLANLSRTLQATRTHYELAGVPASSLDETFGACQLALQQASKQLQAQGDAGCKVADMQLLQSIPGIGPVTAARIHAEIGDVRRFRHAKQLIAYAGLDPSVHSSGNTIRLGKLTKRGSPHLRHAFFIAASVARRYDPELRMVYERKRAEGKAYTQAVTHVARLMVYRVYAIWSRGTPFVKKGDG